MAKNGQLEYIADGTRNAFSIYIEQMNQPFSLSGSQAQTRLHRQFFPKAFSPGNLSITARATSQESYQRFAKFVRNHHVTMVNTPGGMAFTSLDTSSPGYNRLMRLYVVGEGILYRGWIPSFTITKKGVMEPAPQFTFEFYPVFDSHSSNIFASRQIEKLWWAQTGTPVIQISGTNVEQPPDPLQQQREVANIIKTSIEDN